MKIAVRYYSRSGNTRLIAQEIAKEAKTVALQVDDPKSKIDKNVDLLFIGGALYAYGIDKNLKKYLNELNPDYIKKAVVFSSSFVSKHAVSIIKRILTSKNIEVMEEYIYKRGKIKEEDIKDIANKTNEIIRKCR